LTPCNGKAWQPCSNAPWIGFRERSAGSDGVEIDLSDYWVGAHPEGALVLLVVDAPAIEMAEEATEAMVSELLDQTELLAEWRITKCEVGFNELLAKRSLAATEGPDAPPHNPTDRAARHTAERARAETRRAEATGPDEKMKGWILAAAGRLRAFDLDAFGFDPENPDGAVSERLARLAPISAQLY